MNHPWFFLAISILKVDNRRSLTSTNLKHGMPTTHAAIIFIICTAWGVQ